MAVRNTYVENGRTVRVWTESRGKNILERKFFIGYEVNACLNGRRGRKVLQTFDEAVKCARGWQKAIAEKYGFDGWSRDRQVCTHVPGTAFFAVGGGNSASSYITEVGLNETISERLIKRQ